MSSNSPVQKILEDARDMSAALTIADRKKALKLFIVNFFAGFLGLGRLAEEFPPLAAETRSRLLDEVGGLTMLDFQCLDRFIQALGNLWEFDPAVPWPRDYDSEEMTSRLKAFAPLLKVFRDGAKYRGSPPAPADIDKTRNEWKRQYEALLVLASCLYCNLLVDEVTEGGADTELKQFLHRLAEE